MFTSSSHSQYGSTATMREAISNAAKRCVPILDSYPLDQYESNLLRIVADVKEKGIEGAAASAEYRKRMRVFFYLFEKPEEWEVVTGVYGISTDHECFVIRPCTFYFMRDEEWQKWLQRAYCGRYDPLPNTPMLVDQTGMSISLHNNWVAATRVSAVDKTHALAKARLRLEEVLNAIRHSSFQFGNSQKCPRIGLGSPSFWNNSSICIGISKIGEFIRTSAGGGEGFSIGMCKYSPSWNFVVAIVAKDPRQRSSIETAIMTAIEWVGQAAAAPLESIKLVSLMTALEVLVLGMHHGMGKRTKLAARIRTIFSATKDWPFESIDTVINQLYRIRSMCLHAGVNDVPRDSVQQAYYTIDKIIVAFLTVVEYTQYKNHEVLLDALDPLLGHSYEI
jgi:hypothetical protein